MRRKQRPIKLHLINLGLIDKSTLYEEKIEYSNFEFTFFDIITFGILLALIPSLILVIIMYSLYLLIRIWISDNV